ncbi:MAG: (2Fe-2S) ferredoxin [Candidatus Azotimanducaceae bacterium]|jgi:(2Fe-2S) ferredoxin
MLQTEEFIKQANIALTIETSVCMGRCAEGPTVKLAPRGKFIPQANAENIEEAIIRFTDAD